MKTTERKQADPQVPDPASDFDRDEPCKEAGMCRLDNNDDAVPCDRADEIAKAVKNRQDPTHQINGDEEDRSAS